MCCVLRGLRYFEATIQASFNRALNMATDKEKKLVRKKPEKSRVKDPEYQRLPSLRISHIVYGRELRGNRVYYLVDPKGDGTNKKVAESVVLYRWRRRVFVGFTFSGARLGPNLWRTLSKVFSENTKSWLRLSVGDIEAMIDAHREDMRSEFATLPAANVLHALFQLCGVVRLKQLITRHNDPAREGRFGTPDLFLYAIENATGKPSIARFVEVKKPEEPLKPDQTEEIAFLQSLGLHARVLRLDERE
jgi:hypothetical protein